MLENKIKMPFVFAENSRDFFKSNPPTVIFFLCVVFMTATMFSFTYFIKHSDKIVNNDIRQNWISLIKQMNGMELCATNLKKVVWNEVSFTVTLDLNFTDLQFNGSEVEAYYDLKGWQPLCDSSSQQYSSYVKVKFFSPISNETKVCAVITGPRDFLPGNSNQTCASPETTENSTVILESGENCNGTNPDSIKLLFNENEDLVVYLSESDRRVIFVRLLWFSFILLFIVVLMLIYIMTYQSRTTLKSYQMTVAYKHEDPKS